MDHLDATMDALSRNGFRAKFRLAEPELAILREKGLPTVMEHARQLLEKRLAQAVIANDGRQTPWRGHPVFVAQHATATCCRGCVAKWHRIPKGHALSEAELSYALLVIETWLRSACGDSFSSAPPDPPPSTPVSSTIQLKLF